MEKSEMKRIGGEIQEALRKKDWPRGIELLEKWCTHMPSDAAGWYYRAYCLARMSKLIEAKACAERSASLNPGREETQKLLSYLEQSPDKRMDQKAPRPDAAQGNLPRAEKSCESERTLRAQRDKEEGPSPSRLSKGIGEETLQHQNQSGARDGGNRQVSSSEVVFLPVESRGLPTPDVEKRIFSPAKDRLSSDTVSPEPERSTVKGEEGTKERSSCQPRIISPEPGARNLSFSPVSCNRITAGKAGIVIHRKDAGEVPYERIRLVSALEEGRGIDRGVRLLLFVEGHTRPFVAEGKQIQYKDFSSVQGESLTSSLRNFIVLLFNNNRRLLVDQSTWEFMEGKAPSSLGTDIVVIATALAKELEGATGEESASQPEEGTSPGTEERPEATAAGPEQDQRTNPVPETAELAGKMLDEDEEALERIGTLRKHFKAAVENHEHHRIKLLTNANPWAQDRAKALMRQATQQLAEANAAFKLAYLGLFFVSKPGLEAPIAELKEAAREVKSGLSDSFFEVLERSGLTGDIGATDSRLQKILQTLVRAYELRGRMVEVKGKILSEDSGAEEQKTPKPEKSPDEAIPSSARRSEPKPTSSCQPASQSAGIVCPQCGARNQAGAECGVCGILFARNQPFQVLRRNSEKLKIAAAALKKPGRNDPDPRGLIRSTAEEWGDISQALEKGTSKDYVGALLLSHCMSIEKTLLSCGQYSPSLKGIVKETKRVVASLIPDPHHHLTLAGFAVVVLSEASSLQSIFLNPENPFPTDLVPVLERIVWTLRRQGEQLKEACAQAMAYCLAAQKEGNQAEAREAAGGNIDPVCLGREFREFCEYHYDPILFEVMKASYPSKFNQIPGILQMIRSIAELLVGLDVG
jgi:hypothetical protein